MDVQCYSVCRPPRWRQESKVASKCRRCADTEFCTSFPVSTHPAVPLGAQAKPGTGQKRTGHLYRAREMGYPGSRCHGQVGEGRANGSTRPGISGQGGRPDKAYRAHEKRLNFSALAVLYG